MSTETGTAKKISPPYVAYKTLRNFLDGMAQGPVPKKIDRLLMVGQSGSNQAYILSALKFLDLVDDDGNTTAKL